MSVTISIDYPAISADQGEAIKGRLQEKDILGDFGPGASLWQHLLGKPRPDMTWCNIIDPDWFEMNWQEEGKIVPLTNDGKQKLTLTLMEIYNVASGPITLICQRHGENPQGQKELNINEFSTMLESEGLPYRTLIVLDRRLGDR